MKGLAIVGDDPALLGICKQLDEQREHANERVKFLQKQADALAEQYKKDSEGLWEQLRVQLLKMGKLPAEYTKDTHTLHYNKESGIICMTNKGEEDSGFKDFLRRIFNL